MTDILIAEDGTIFKDGDINVGECDAQNKKFLIEWAKGSVKEFPATCVGAESFLEDEDPSAFLREVRTQYVADGMKVNKIILEEGKIKIDANY